MFKAVLRAELYRGVYDPGVQTKPPLFSSDPIALTAVTEVWPDGSIDQIGLVRSDSLDSAIVSSAWFEGLVGPSTARPNESMFRLVGLFEFDSPPCNLAFDVVVEYEGDSRLLGAIKYRPGPSRRVHFAQRWRISGVAPEKIDIRLRASPDAARDTTDIFEIWGGSLRFKDLPVDESLVRFGLPRVPAVLDED